MSGVGLTHTEVPDEWRYDDSNSLPYLAGRGWSTAMNWPVFCFAFVCSYALTLTIAIYGREIYYSIKRKLMRIRCLFGGHDYKMGVPAKGGGGFGCLWCRKPVPQKCDHERVYMGDNGLPRHPLSGAYFNYCPTCGVKV